MENLEWILSLIATVLSLLIACISFGIKLIKNVREKIRTKKYNELIESIAPIMEIAENNTQLHGADKKDYVMDKVSQYAVENRLIYDAKAVADKIEELVAFSKQINKREE